MRQARKAVVEIVVGSKVKALVVVLVIVVVGSSRRRLVVCVIVIEVLVAVE